MADALHHASSFSAAPAVSDPHKSAMADALRCASSFSAFPAVPDPHKSAMADALRSTTAAKEFQDRPPVIPYNSRDSVMADAFRSSLSTTPQQAELTRNRANTERYQPSAEYLASRADFEKRKAAAEAKTSAATSGSASVDDNPMLAAFRVTRGMLSHLPLVRPTNGLESSGSMAAAVQLAEAEAESDRLHAEAESLREKLADAEVEKIKMAALLAEQDTALLRAKRALAVVAFEQPKESPSAGPPPLNNVGVFAQRLTAELVMPLACGVAAGMSGIIGAAAAPKGRPSKRGREHPPTGGTDDAHASDGMSSPDIDAQGLHPSSPPLSRPPWHSDEHS